MPTTQAETANDQMFRLLKQYTGDVPEADRNGVQLVLGKLWRLLHLSGNERSSCNKLLDAVEPECQTHPSLSPPEAAGEYVTRFREFLGRNMNLDLCLSDNVIQQD